MICENTFPESSQTNFVSFSIYIHTNHSLITYCQFMSHMVRIGLKAVSNHHQGIVHIVTLSNINGSQSTPWTRHTYLWARLTNAGTPSDPSRTRPPKVINVICFLIYNVIYSDPCSTHPHRGILTYQQHTPKDFIDSNYNTSMFYKIAIFVKCCYTTDSWLFWLHVVRAAHR